MHHICTLFSKQLVESLVGYCTKTHHCLSDTSPRKLTVRKVARTDSVEFHYEISIEEVWSSDDVASLKLMVAHFIHGYLAGITNVQADEQAAVAASADNLS